METTTIFGILLFVAAIAAGAYAYYNWRRMKLIDETPTSKPGEVSAGTVEVEGTARPQEGHTLRAPFSNEDCVAYEYEVEKYRRKRNSSNSSGSKGRWKTVDSDSKTAPFRVVDETGEVNVEPFGADLELFEEKYSDDSSSSSGLGGLTGPSYGDKRRTEKHIGVGDSVYVFGHADVGKGVDDEDVAIMDAGSTPMFLISDQMADELVSTKTTRVILSVVVGVVCAGGGIAMLAGMF